MSQVEMVPDKINGTLFLDLICFSAKSHSSAIASAWPLSSKITLGKHACYS